jgi:hypothetical protein
MIKEGVPDYIASEFKVNISDDELYFKEADNY